jgi:hypothetical protein
MQERHRLEVLSSPRGLALEIFTPTCRAAAQADSLSGGQGRASASDYRPRRLGRGRRIIILGYLMTCSVPADPKQEDLISVLEEAGCPPVRHPQGAAGFLQIRGTPLETEIGKKGPLDYNQGIRLALCLQLQLDALQERGQAMLGLELEDVVVLEGGWFLLVNTHMCVPVDPAGTIEVRAPPVARLGAQPGTLGGINLAPELRGQLSLPLRTSITCSHYSLAKLVAQSMGIKKSLAPLAETRLYYFLKRCLMPDPAQRTFFFI